MVSPFFKAYDLNESPHDALVPSLLGWWCVTQLLRTYETICGLVFVSQHKRLSDQRISARVSTTFSNLPKSKFLEVLKLGKQFFVTEQSIHINEKFIVNSSCRPTCWRFTNDSPRLLKIWPEIFRASFKSQSSFSWSRWDKDAWNLKITCCLILRL